MNIKLNWLGPDQRLFLERNYLKKGVSPEKRYNIICDTIQRISGINGIGDRFRKYISDGWVSFATPVLANFGEPDNLPISCNKGVISDNLSDILLGIHEMGMLAKYGAGTAYNFSNIRPIGENIATGGVSEGVIPWIGLYAKAIDKISQGATRRGFLTAYLDVNHKEINDFLDIGTEGHSIQNITTGVTIPEGWIDSLKNGDIEKRKIWAKIAKRRSEFGFPYIIYLDNCNNSRPQVYVDKDMFIKTSNICSEIIEYCDDEKTFACCLSSVVAYYYDDWKNDPNFIFDMNIMLDCVIEEYIIKGRNLPGLEKAVKFAKDHRAIGLGILGFHSYLQSKMITVGSIQSFQFNNQIFSYIKKESDRASKWMAENWGEPEILKGYGYRNTTRIAQAPTKSTSYLCGNMSQGIEPIKSNYTEKKLAGIQVEYKNPELVKLLIKHNQNNPDVWKSILNNNGSVQKLEFLSRDEKNVFKTFSEISQQDLINLAAERQKFIDQGQSLNLMIHPSTSAKDVNKLLLSAHEKGIKALYYQYSINAAQEYNKELLECSSCEA